MRSKGKSIHPVQTAIEFIQHENIKKYDEALLKGEKKEDRKSAIRNKIKADDQHLKVLALGYEFIKSMTEASD